MTDASGSDALLAVTDYAIVGGGIVGLAVARQLLIDRPNRDVIVLEKEGDIAAHQTGRNSGVVHAGIYYAPGSQKATLTKRAIPLLREYAQANNVAFEECGKIVVATSSDESARLDELFRRATANGVPGLELIDTTGIEEHEPAAIGQAAIWSPTTAITDFVAIAEALKREVTAMGGSVHTFVEVRNVSPTRTHVLLTTTAGRNVRCGSAIICAGVHSDRLARAAGGDREPDIIPFRGEYLHLVGSSRNLVNGLIYPVPDPRYPFLGVHFTPTVHGKVLVGPNAVLALARDGYRWRDIDIAHIGDLSRSRGFRRLASRHWQRGIVEAWRSLNRRAYLREVQRYLPAIRSHDLVPTNAGVRAQAVSRQGDLINDFVITRTDRVVAVRNAPSPGATAALALAEEIVAATPE